MSIVAQIWAQLMRLGNVHSREYLRKSRDNNLLMLWKFDSFPSGPHLILRVVRACLPIRVIIQYPRNFLLLCPLCKPIIKVIESRVPEKNQQQLEDRKVKRQPGSYD